MFNSHGWIIFGMNRKDSDMSDDTVQSKFDQLDIELQEKIQSKLKEIANSNEIINFNLLSGMNNLENFLSVQLSRNHFNPTLREFYKWLSEVSDGSHGILYELDDERENFNPDKPYTVWRLIGKDFEECNDSIINEKFHKVNY